MEYNIIGDIAGEYETLVRLLAQMPKDARPLSIGDMCDRGPRSRDVMDYFRYNGDAMLGNHEHMFIDYIEKKGFYDKNIWFLNGGFYTLASFIRDSSVKDDYLDKAGIVTKWLRQAMLNDLSDGRMMAMGTLIAQMDDIFRPYKSEVDEVVKWLTKRPLSLLDYEDGKPHLLVTHGPFHPHYDHLEQGLKMGENSHDPTLEWSVLWSRAKPRRRDYFQVHGHNALKVIDRCFYSDDEGDWGVNLDTSKAGYLTGMHWPSKQLFHQEFV